MNLMQTFLLTMEIDSLYYEKSIFLFQNLGFMNYFPES
jgi:hypothetical protein